MNRRHILAQPNVALVVIVGKERSPSTKRRYWERRAFIATRARDAERPLPPSTRRTRGTKRPSSQPLAHGVFARTVDTLRGRRSKSPQALPHRQARVQRRLREGPSPCLPSVGVRQLDAICGREIAGFPRAHRVRRAPYPAGERDGIADRCGVSAVSVR